MALERKRDKEKEYAERVYVDRERAHREAPSFSARFPKQITLCILDSVVQLKTRNLSRRSVPSSTEEEIGRRAVIIFRRSKAFSGE